MSRLIGLRQIDPGPNDDLVEFVLAGLGPSYRPLPCHLNHVHEEITFDALYGLLLSEERQLKRDEVSYGHCAYGTIYSEFLFYHPWIVPPMMPQSSVPTPTSNQPSPSPYIESLTNPRSLTYVDPITGHTHAIDPPSQDDISHGVALISPSVVAENPHSSNTSHSADFGNTSAVDMVCPAALSLQKMVTRTQTGSLKPKKPFSMSTTTPTSAIVEPSCHSQAIKDVHWRHAMSE
ncbi:hypothetical protein H5410_038446, partial [Solanum commersonii]